MRLNEEIEVRYIGPHQGGVPTGRYPVLSDGDGVLFVRVDQSDMNRFTRICRVGALGEMSFHRFVIGGREMLILVPCSMDRGRHDLSAYMKAAMIKLRDLLIHFFFEDSGSARITPGSTAQPAFGSIDLSRGRVVEL